MVNKTVPEVPKIAKTTRKPKSSRTSPETANKKRFVEVIDVIEDGMAEASGLTEEIAISRELRLQVTRIMKRK